MAPKLRAPRKLKQSKLDNNVSQNLALRRPSAPAADNEPSLGLASAKDDRATLDNDWISGDRELLKSLDQDDRVQLDPREKAMRSHNMAVEALYGVTQNLDFRPRTQTDPPKSSKKRLSQDTKSQKNGTSSQFTYKKRYNTAKRRAAKFDFPTEIVRLILRCLISEDQTFESDFCTAVCFALTCRSHWEIFRTIHSRKVSLLVQAPNTSNKRKAGLRYRLGELLITWMLPKYRPLSYTVFHDEMVMNLNSPIDVFVSIAVYSKVDGEKDRKLALRIAQYRHNHFADFYCIYHEVRYLAPRMPEGLTWFVPNPFGMGDEWYAATARFLKHTIFRWKYDCHTDREYHWLNSSEEYTRHYRVWTSYKTWMMRDWVEEQPEAIAYKRSCGLGEDKKKVGMRDGFEMLKLVDVQSKEHKLKVKQVVNAMLKLVKNRPSY